MKKNDKIIKLTECAVLVAIAVVLSLIKIAELPYGGSITLASLLPIVIISYRHGIKWGLGSGLVFAIIQQLFGLNNLSYATSWKAVIAIIMLDYILAFTFAGLGGIFRNTIKSQQLALILGSLFVGAIRYLCHIISGATVWAGISIPTKAALVYSVAYNGAFMLPEISVLVIVAILIGGTMDLRAKRPTRLKSSTNLTSYILYTISGIILCGGLIFDVINVFMHLQNEEGVFDIAGINNTDWKTVITVSVCCVTTSAIIAVGSFFANKKQYK